MSFEDKGLTGDNTPHQTGAGAEKQGDQREYKHMDKESQMTGGQREASTKNDR